MTTQDYIIFATAFSAIAGLLILCLRRLSESSNSPGGDVTGFLADAQNRQQDALRQTATELTRLIVDTNQQVQHLLTEKTLQNANDIQTKLSANSEKLSLTLQTGLTAGRAEQQNTLTAVSKNLEGKFESLRAAHEQKTNHLTAALNDSLAKSRGELTLGLRQATQNLDLKFAELRKVTETKLLEIRGEVETKLTSTVQNNMKHFANVTEQLSKLNEATGQIVTLSKGVNDLNVLLQTPNARGAFGELTLQQMLADVFGDYTDMFALQYALDDNVRADAAIYIGLDRKQVLCIDSKFPLANAKPLMDNNFEPSQANGFEKAFARDVMERAKEIREKYISPPKTMDFAMMFVPAESIFYLLLRNRKVHEDLLRMRVIPVSPNSFYAYLQALAHGYRGLKIQQKAEELQKAIGQIGRDFERFADDYRLVGKHLTNAASKYQDTQQDIDRFTRRIDGLKLAESGDTSQLRLAAPEPEEMIKLPADV
jgi:DNA recombination protein RmuC